MSGWPDASLSARARLPACLALPARRPLLLLPASPWPPRSSRLRGGGGVAACWPPRQHELSRLREDQTPPRAVSRSHNGGLWLICGLRGAAAKAPGPADESSGQRTRPIISVSLGPPYSHPGSLLILWPRASLWALKMPENLRPDTFEVARVPRVFELHTASFSTSFVTPSGTPL
ncbi:unnamed protein product [Prorocentrum cordatum]|uniref:Uncharacterized protein n=1 Tax=Prorocentrum cordatum TaxID=2364126 RepID=A0ABN9U6D3_9DINO|nr:unnamed protein product [Polarella glacialis]